MVPDYIPNYMSKIRGIKNGFLLFTALGDSNRVGTKCGIESISSLETSILEAKIDFSSSTCAHSFLLVYHLEIFIQEESIPATK